MKITRKLVWQVWKVAMGEEPVVGKALGLHKKNGFGEYK
jgi:hypothetical protein